MDTQAVSVGTAYNSMVRVNPGNQVQVHQTVDRTPEKLFECNDVTFLTQPHYAKFVRLLDNFTKRTDLEDVKTSSETAEIEEFCRTS